MKRRTLPPLPPRVPYPQTPETAHAWIRAHGICMADLARAHGLRRTVLVDLLRGRNRGLRGQAHLGAVLLGLKPDPGSLSARGAA